jgi:hypothetical protein
MVLYNIQNDPMGGIPKTTKNAVSTTGFSAGMPAFGRSHRASKTEPADRMNPPKT